MRQPIRSLLWIIATVSGLALATVFVPDIRDRQTWFAAANPGPLSHGHAHLADDCNACHTPWNGVEDQNCISCHANDRELLQRQPTSFHASVGNCAACHPEHGAWPSTSTRMDHTTFARIGLRKLVDSGHGSAASEVGNELEAWGLHRSAANSEGVKSGHISPEEAALNCSSCHGNEDVHQSLLGNDCASCHTTSKWTLPTFRHPSPSSRSCAQCHQAPPSHYMMHFNMVSAKVARNPKADVRQCFGCHQTNSWNDIKGVGFYKHH